MKLKTKNIEVFMVNQKKNQLIPSLIKYHFSKKIRNLLENEFLSI